MGYMQHHTIVVCGFDVEALTLAHGQAKEIFSGACEVSDLTPEATNGYQSFFVAPDGSKEGWLRSAEADDARQNFVKTLRSICYFDGSQKLQWVEVLFGDDAHEARILASSERRAE